MVQASRPKINVKPVEILEGQIRECFGRSVYTHKTHEKCSDILNFRHNLIIWAQILLSAITTGSFVSIFLGSEHIGSIVGALFSGALLVLNAYTKDYNLGEKAQLHKQAANSVWLIKEKYLSLLTDLRAGALQYNDGAKQRDLILNEYHSALEGIPATNSKAYFMAQKSLKYSEDHTFSDDEIDSFLPKELKKANKISPLEDSPAIRTTA